MTSKNDPERLAGDLTLDAILRLNSVEKERFGLTHTPHEIAQQPATWGETFRIIETIQPAVYEFLKKCGLDGNAGSFAVTLVGAGTSDYIGRALETLLRTKWNCHVRAVPSTDMLTEMDEIVAAAPDGMRHLWISFSRSGDSFEGVTAIRRALEKYPQINHLIVTCSKNGKMASELTISRANMFCIILDDKVNDRGLAMTSSFTNMVIAGQCLAHISDLQAYKPIVEALAIAAGKVLPGAASLGQLVAEKDYSRICFLGSGALKAAGDESALKVMELTAGHFSIMSESFLGLRHGPLAWLNSESLVVGFLSGNRDKSKIEIGLIEELNRKRAAKSILLILPNENFDISAEFRLALDIPETMHDSYRPPLDVLFAQCLGLFASLHYGLRPDTPSVDNKIQRVVSSIG